MAAKRKIFNETSGLESFDELLLFLLASGAQTISDLEKGFEEFENKSSQSYIKKILDVFENSLIRFLIIENKNSQMVKNGRVFKVITYTLCDDAKNIDVRNLAALVGNNLLSTYNIFVKKYPELEKYFNKTVIIDDYDRPEENLPDEKSLCEIIIYLLFYKGQMRICDMVEKITELYGKKLYSELEIMGCIRNVLSKKQIFNLISKLNMTNEARYTYFLKKQVFSDGVKYEELEELCSIEDVNDFCLIDFLKKYKHLRTYFDKKPITKVKLLKHNDLSKNHLVETIFFIMLLNTTFDSLSTDEIYKKITELNPSLSQRYNINNIDSIFEEFGELPIKNIFVQYVSADNNIFKYGVRSEAIESNITIDDMFDLYMPDRGAIESFCEKYPNLRNLFPSFDISSPVVTTIEIKSDETNDMSNKETDEDVSDIGDTIDHMKEKLNLDTDEIPCEISETTLTKDISDMIKKLLKDISNENITININVSGDLIINN